MSTFSVMQKAFLNATLQEPLVDEEMFFKGEAED